MRTRPPSTGSTQRACLIGCLIAALVGIAGCLVVFAVGWKPFVKFGITGDLEELRAFVRESDLDPDAKARVVARFDALRQRAREKPIGLMQWVQHEEVVRALVEDRSIPPDELEQLEDRLGLIEQDFGVAPEAAPPEPAEPAEPPKPASAT